MLETSSVAVPLPLPQPKTNWYRQLKDGRLEVNLKGDGGLYLRASGPESQIWSLVALFEEMTGQEAVGEWKRPPRTGARPMDGQLDLTEMLENG